MSSSQLTCLASLLALAGPWLAGTSRAASPTVSGLPTVNPPVVVADGTTSYTVTTTVTDPDGYNDIRCIRNLFNYTESGGDQTKGRGLMAWGKSDGDIAQYGGTWVFADANDQGRWGYRTDAWGTTTYVSLLSCTTSTAGKASGGSGSRTVSWTFSVKPAWAGNPLMNDVDVWVADGTSAIGWLDGQAWFDVVPASCTAVCPPPREPVIGQAGDDWIEVALNPSDPGDQLYAIAVRPNLGAKEFVQGDGTLGVTPTWSTRSNWGTKAVTGLLPNTTYAFTVRAARTTAGWCPSSWGPAAAATTTGTLALVDPRAGNVFSTGVRGQCPYRSLAPGKYGWEPVWDLAIGSMGRGLAGGLDADCYDWRDIDSGSGWGTPAWSGEFTSLQFLQYARDHQALPIITANLFGGGYRDFSHPTYPGVFVCRTADPGGLAADWVRYTNVILQTYRQGSESSMTSEDARVYGSIRNWGGRPKLLAPAEGAVPRVQYWEIGNEPEVPGYYDFLADHYLSPNDHRDRYKLISEAMLAVDASLKFGPCLITPHDPNGSGQWLTALAADPAARVDFVAYHPYGSLKGSWGHPQAMTAGLVGYKAFLNARSEGIRSIMNQHGRTGFDLIASEWDPVSWDAPGHIQSSMLNALGVAETCFTFAEDGVLAGTFWANPHDMVSVREAFAKLVSHMGNVLVSSGAQLGYDPAISPSRVYVTKNAGDDRTLMIWGLNFDDAELVTLSMGIWPCRLESARLMRLGRPGDDASGGDTSLTSSSGLAWNEQDVTAGLDPDGFTLVMDDAEITLLVLRIQLTAKADFDRDLDVDQADFGYLQACLTGAAVTVTNPDCMKARLDADGDVDHNDVTAFLACFGGPGEPAEPSCTP